MRRGALLAGLLGLPMLAAQAYEPRVNYMLQCMGCHTPDGSGEPGRVPSMKETLLPFARSPDGRRFLVQVPGAAQSQLTDAELAELTNWMILNLGGGKAGGFAPFTGAEVTRYRRTPLVNVRATRAALMKSTGLAHTPQAGRVPAGGG